MPIQEIRAFNRFYTNLIGALDYSKHLYTPYTLTESRVLYELAHSPRTDAADLRAELSLDAGYLSRMLAKFERDGLVARAPSEVDPRRQRITLTAHGREAAALLDERSREAVGSLLAKVPADVRPRLVEATRTVREILGGDRPAHREGPVLRDPGPGDLGWVVQRHGALYAAEYGWNADFEGLVARIVADFAQDHDPHLERVWIAELEGRPVGSVMCVRDDAPATARLRLLLVEPEARGHGLGDQLVRGVVDFARDVGYRELVLWTNDVLTGARRIYQRAGFTLVAEKPHRSYGVDLVGQDWRLPLQERTIK
ncbi:MarR family transcriptional regulator [Streptomyces lunaelactis]|uniref:bifunctional helix-turn-helix transcriptional regulator/GNAT family N-acetyltransferase n=1 Tax=Streptomyces lunaelactis TaxID=1535768 RepID=UPI0015850BEB|nr:helix-turn-helix domain-containing GNAT family N-acetyltransferase [Streptomyces lunaelactis]NUK05776.1 MarR family transcriptional regulator [Streptomyces lunaelactis]NUK12441.1 MarR family transcriptional regulator [Streptomyces lunaelactis]NUK20269.1 MarR family transcriptional regulator [Streptomyces lunaelactis]NUK27708.1 MarR family transcriptional regulator [Streptomyces lunaelactis]NUK38786.1 MarR family transcriptional regulator [Streptomyces lunaelactis]